MLIVRRERAAHCERSLSICQSDSGRLKHLRPRKKHRIEQADGNDLSVRLNIPRSRYSNGRVVKTRIHGRSLGIDRDSGFEAGVDRIPRRLPRLRASLRHSTAFDEGKSR